MLFREIGIDESQRDAVKSKIPRGIPGVFPLVGHGDDVVVIEVGPILVAAFLSVSGRHGAGGIAFEPRLHVVVIKLF